MGARVSKRKHTITHEQENFTRFGLAIVGVGTNVLKEILETYIPSKDIASKVTSTSHPSLWRRGLNQRQIRLIGQAATDGYRDFDITLCYTLLRNLNVRVHAPFSAPFPNPTQGWGKKPNPTDTTQSDDIERIRILRNEMYGHLANPSIPKEHFTDIWNELRDVCTRMKTNYPSGTDFLQELKSLESSKVSRDLLDNIVDLVKQSREYSIQIDAHGTQLDEHSTHLATLDTEVQSHGTQLDEHERHLDSLDESCQNHETQIANIKEQLKSDQHNPDEEPDVSKLKQRLIKVNRDLTKVITLSPLQQRGRALPIELLFSQVVIREDQKKREKGDNSGIDTTKQLPVRDRGVDMNTDWKSETDSNTDYESVGHSTRLLSKHLIEDKKEPLNPDDLFKAEDEVSNIIFMLGDAAHGKTTYCLWLAKNWCNAQQEDSLGRELDVWEAALKEFDFVFLLQFRNVNPYRACVVDMICHDVSRSLKGCHAAIRHVLSSEKYRSLVIMDGLDEWNPNDETVNQGMPNLDELSSKVTTFISMRPWVFALISKLVQGNDIVTEILGLSETGMENVIKNVLINRFLLTENSSKFNDVYNRIRMNLDKESLKSFMQIPLLAVVCVQIWYEEKQVGDSMTSFYAEMLNMLIERANEKHDLEIGNEKNVEYRLPELLSQHKSVRNFNSILVKLGKVAYEGLISKETDLVFQKGELEDKIGERDLQFTLDVGLISQKEAPSFITKNVSIHFFHKSIQEFLAAIYIVTNKEVGESFCNHLSSVKIIMEMSNVIRFICGMCPTLGSVIPQRVVSVTDSDIEICRYRESPADSTIVEELYKLQVSWHKELQCGQIESPAVFNVSDIYLKSSTSSIETVMGTRELLHGASVNIKSLHLWWVPIDEKSGITNAQVNNFLGNKDNTRSLTKVIICGDYGRILHPISQPTHLRYLHLHNLEISKSDHYGNVCPQLLKDMPSLRELYLYDVTLNDKGLYLSADMVHIEMVTLESVNMSAALWQQFILSVLNIQHRFDVELWGTNIDDESKSKIRSSVDFSITQDGLVKDVWDMDDGYKYKLTFTRVWPLLHTTRYDDDGNEILYTKL